MFIDFLIFIYQTTLVGVRFKKNLKNVNFFLIGFKAIFIRQHISNKSIGKVVYYV